MPIIYQMKYLHINQPNNCPSSQTYKQLHRKGRHMNPLLPSPGRPRPSLRTTRSSTHLPAAQASGLTCSFPRRLYLFWRDWSKYLSFPKNISKSQSHVINSNSHTSSFTQVINKNYLLTLFLPTQFVTFSLNIYLERRT